MWAIPLFIISTILKIIVLLSVARLTVAAPELTVPQSEKHQLTDGGVPIASPEDSTPGHRNPLTQATEAVNEPQQPTAPTLAPSCINSLTSSVQQLTVGKQQNNQKCIRLLNNNPDLYHEINQECLYFKLANLCDLDGQAQTDFIKFRQKVRKEACGSWDKLGYRLLFEKAVEEFRRSHYYTTCDQQPCFVKYGSFLEIKIKQLILKKQFPDITDLTKSTNSGYTGFAITELLMIPPPPKQDLGSRYTKWLMDYYPDPAVHGEPVCTSYLGGLVNWQKPVNTIVEVHIKPRVSNIDFADGSEFNQFIEEEPSLLSEWRQQPESRKRNISQFLEASLTFYNTASAPNAVFSHLGAHPLHGWSDLSHYNCVIKDFNVIQTIEILDTSGKTMIHTPFTPTEIRTHGLKRMRRINRMTLFGQCLAHLYSLKIIPKETQKILNKESVRNANFNQNFPMGYKNSFTATIVDPMSNPTAYQATVYQGELPNSEKKKQLRGQKFETLFLIEDTSGLVVVRPNITDSCSELDNINVFHVQYERPADANEFTPAQF